MFYHFDSPGSMIGSIHLLAAAVVHGLLLQFQLTESLANRHTVWNRASRSLALACMKLQKSPNSFADMTSTSGLYLAL
jgi:hypothetical protein